MPAQLACIVMFIRLDARRCLCYNVGYEFDSFCGEEVINTMTHDLRTRFQRGDVLAIALVAILALAVMLCFLPNGGDAGGMVEIYRDGERIATLPLQEDAETEIGGAYRNVITVSGGRTAITQSDCPGGDCVHSGWIDGVGRSFVCLPNRVEVRIVGTESEVDFVVG